MEYADRIGESIARALEIAKVKHVVNLSSVGAELSEGTGPVKGLHNMEERLNRIKGLNVLHLRPAYFMENLLWSIDLIRSKGINGDSIRGDLKIPMIATKDVAAYAADRLVKKDFTGSSVRYLLGQRDLSMIEAAEIIGKKIDIPGLSYVMFPYDEAEKAMVAMGLSPDMSRLYIEMSRAFNEGRIAYEKRTRENTTLTSFEAFCDEVFVPVYTQKKAA
ncbi:MAG: epimerase [Betaproteobacteria bacterium]